MRACCWVRIPDAAAAAPRPSASVPVTRSMLSPPRPSVRDGARGGRGATRRRGSTSGPITSAAITYAPPWSKRCPCTRAQQPGEREAEQQRAVGELAHDQALAPGGDRGEGHGARSPRGRRRTARRAGRGACGPGARRPTSAKTREASHQDRADQTRGEQRVRAAEQRRRPRRRDGASRARDRAARDTSARRRASRASPRSLRRRRPSASTPSTIAATSTTRAAGYAPRPRPAGPSPACAA